MADDPGMMESLLHTDKVSVKDKVMCETYTNNQNNTNVSLLHSLSETDHSRPMLYLCG